MSNTSSFSIVKISAMTLALLAAGCVVQPPLVSHATVQPVPIASVAPRVVSVYVDPPLYQPTPIAVAWAPPPMLVERPPSPPFAGAVWTGGYWTWQGNWVWAAGRWASPPEPGYSWVQPYYEHRDGMVVFITGHWSAPGVAFIPPPPGLGLVVSAAAAGVVAGLAPIGPQGVFVPAPPGSRLGLIVPAPVGTPPAVVVSAPPVTNVGMRVQNTTIYNVTNTTTNVTNVTNINNTRTVTVVAPASATASGRSFEAAVPASAHLAAALPSVVHAMAPVPDSAKPVAALVPGHPPVAPRPVEPARQTVAVPPQIQVAPAEAHPRVAPPPVAAKVVEPAVPAAASARPTPEAPRRAEPVASGPQRPPSVAPASMERERQVDAPRRSEAQQALRMHEPMPKERPAPPVHVQAGHPPASPQHVEQPKKEEHRE